MSDASIVFITSLTMKPPGQVIFHAPDRKWNFTDCGLVVTHALGCPHEDGCANHVVWERYMLPCRRDTAEVIGRPCGRCRW